MGKMEWICCPVCGGKTRNRIRENIVLINYPHLVSIGSYFCINRRSQPSVDTLNGADWWYATAQIDKLYAERMQGGKNNDFRR